MDLGIKIKASNDFLRVDQFLKGGGVQSGERLANGVYPKKFLQRDLKKIADLIAFEIKKNISSARRYDGRGKLRKLAPSTVRRKGFSTILIETGQLLNSIEVKKVGTTYLVQVKNVRHKGSESTVSEIATYLQQGTDRMPARPFFGITKKKLTEIVNSVIKLKK